MEAQKLCGTFCVYGDRHWYGLIGQMESMPSEWLWPFGLRQIVCVKCLAIFNETADAALLLMTRAICEGADAAKSCKEPNFLRKIF